jgi:uncharacterized PurR-regulated membrane protein YhhQ (DUF165 family)
MILVLMTTLGVFFTKLLDTVIFPACAVYRIEHGSEAYERGTWGKNVE